MPKTLFFYAATIFQLGLRFVQMIIVTRNLSSFNLGVYYVSAAYPQLLSRVFDFGLPHAVRYFMLSVPSANRTIMKMLLSFPFLIFLPIFAFFYFIDSLPLEAGEIGKQMSDNVLSLSFYCLLLIVNSILNSILLSFEKFKTLLVSSIVPYCFFIVIIAHKASLSELSVSDVLLQLSISEVITLMIYLFSVATIIKQKSEEPLTLKMVDVIRYALRIYPNGFLKVITTRLDRVVLSFVATPVFIGYYSVFMTIRDISIVPVTTYGQVFMNQLSEFFKSKKDGLVALLNKNLMLVTIVYTLGFITYLLLQDVVLGLFFKELTHSLLQASFVLFLSIIPLALLSLLSSFFLVANRPSDISWSSVIMIVVFYSIVYLSYDRLGSESFLYASVLSTLFGFLFLFFKMKLFIKGRLTE